MPSGPAASDAQASSQPAAEALPPVARRPGRPRSEQAEKAILAAALDLFAECGPDSLCIEQVAAKAGVGKATIYRRWPGKEDMLVDAIGTVGYATARAAGQVCARRPDRTAQRDLP